MKALRLFRALFIMALLIPCASIADVGFTDEVELQFVEEAAKCWAFFGSFSTKATKRGDNELALNLAQAAVRLENIAAPFISKEIFDRKVNDYLKKAPWGIFDIDAVNKDCTQAAFRPDARYAYWNAKVRQSRNRPLVIGYADAMESDVSLAQALSSYRNKNFSLALSLTEPIAQQGNLEAMRLLGAIYSNANGAVKNLTLAEEWLTKAAELGHIASEFDLAQLCLFYMVPPNKEKGTLWMTHAAQGGYPKAQTWIDGLKG